MTFSNRYAKPYQRPAGRFAEGERRAITARFAGRCRSCGRPTAEGDTVYWASGAGAICQDCQDGKPVQTALPDVPVEAPQSRMAVEDAGVYVLPDGTIVKVQANREKTRTYAKRFVEIRAERATEAGTRAHGEYVYEPHLVEQVAREGRKMTLGEAKAFILRYGFCVRCGRALKAAESVERGIGPVCWRYFASAEHEHTGEGEGEGEASIPAGTAAPTPAAVPTMDGLRRAGVTDPEWIAMVPPTPGNPTGYYRGVEFPNANPLPLAERPAWDAVAPHVRAFLRGPRVGLYLAEDTGARRAPEDDTDAHFARLFERLDDAMYGPGDGI